MCIAREEEDGKITYTLTLMENMFSNRLKDKYNVPFTAKLKKVKIIPTSITSVDMYVISFIFEDIK